MTTHLKTRLMKTRRLLTSDSPDDSSPEEPEQVPVPE